MNHFEKHGLMHLSPSTINQWIAEPALCLLKIAGITDGEAGAAAWRGTSADRALAKVASNNEMPDEDLIQIANKIFDEQHSNAQNHHDEEKVQKERNELHQYITVGAKFYRSLGEKPESEQGKVTTMLPEINIPFIGYYDLLYKDKVRDTKTVGRMTSSVTQAHNRQASLYGYVLQKEPWLDYVGKKEVRAFKVDNVPYYIKQMQLAALSLERVLSYSDDIFECCQLVFPDFDNFRWSEITKAAAKDIWKMER